MDLELKNKVIIVTGGAKGIGASIVRTIAKEGGIPVILSRSPLSKEFEEEIASLQPQYGFYQINLRENEIIGSLIEKIIQKYGCLYGVVNNAGANDNLSLEDTPYEKFMDSLQGNLIHYYTVVHHCLPYLKKSQGSIINVSSKTALTGQGKTSAYAAAKGAQLALTREWAAALAKDNIRVNAIVPSEVLTPLYLEWLKNFENPEEKLQEIGKKIPLGKRLTTAEEIATTTVFVLSPISSHTTGQILFVDGGYVHLDRALT
ncbi:SDR family oxidoreductase [Helicobacter sp. 11S03491-1]|uniref:SDR family oxidoreductase n=1 Tax=Helicobacter sp. 11S03491-1 TaxID=1476196 RepID=UPI000BA524F9|nr:SDR family oxidoreductase [Helicobacter sp. 11S03491-1]PAF42283.1 short-chain dehydrogenase [Helicobacter sp. 11S03491-1]